MIARRPGLIDSMISSLSAVAALRAAQPPPVLSSPLPVVGLPLPLCSWVEAAPHPVFSPEDGAAADPLAGVSISDERLQEGL